MNRLILILLISLSITACKEEKTASVEADDISIPPSTMNALTAVTYPKGSLKFFDMNMQPLTNPSAENQIMVCTPKMETCWSTCVSIYFPTVDRYSVFKTDWLQGNKCVAYALQYPNGDDVPRLKYYEGTYAGSTCTINPNAPDFDGRGVVTEVRVPNGQVSSHPQQKRIYEVHNFLDSNENFLSSIYLYNFRPPSAWDYEDSSVASGYITPQLVNGFSCIRENQIQ